MNLPIYKEELDIGGILKYAWEHFWKNWKTILFIVLLVYIPVNIILGMIPVEQSVDIMWSLESLKVHQRISNLLEWLLGSLATVSIAIVIKNSLSKKQLSFKEALWLGSRRWWAAIWTAFVLGVFMIGLFIALIVPGVIFAVFWKFAIIAVAIIPWVHSVKALRRSKQAVKWRWWTVLGYSIVFGLAVTVPVIAVYFGLSFGVAYVLEAANHTVQWILYILLDTALDFGLAFMIAINTIFFINFDHTKKLEEKEESEAKAE